MMIICLCIGILALLFSGINIILYCADKKREKRQKAAMLDYIRAECDGVLNAAESSDGEILSFAKDALSKQSLEFAQKLELINKAYKERLEKMEQTIARLENGLCPDYEQALAAAQVVNDFNAGISAIMNFDPIEVARKQRQSGSKEDG